MKLLFSSIRVHLCLSVVLHLFLLDSARAQRITDFPAITGSAVDPAADLLLLNDTSAGTAGSKKITLAELVNVSSFTNGNFLAANSVEFAQVNGLTAALDGKVDDSQLSTTGGANKVLQYDSSGNLSLGPYDNRNFTANPSTGYLGSAFGSVGNIYIPDQQGLIWRDPATGGAIFNIRHWRGHDATYGESIIESAWRIAILGQGPIQFGHNEANRTAQVLHMVSGPATVGDPIKHSKAISQQAYRYNGGTASVGYSVMQTTSINDGPDDTVWRLNINEGDPATVLPTNGFNGFTPGSTTTGVALGTTVLQAGMSGISTPGVTITSGNLVFSDATTLGSTGDIVDLIDTETAPRTGFVTLTAGEGTVADASITGFTEIIISHKTAAGTLGHLSVVKDYGVGFDVVSTSATDTSTVSYVLLEGNVSDIPAPTISGTSAITDTLTVAGGFGPKQWYANDVAISGQTGTTYAIGAAYIGQAISCYVGGVESNAITAWHPDDESGYFADYRADQGLYQNPGSSAATANADLVGQWQDQSGNNRHLLTLTDAKRPALDLTTRPGFPHLKFDGSDDYMYYFATISRPQTAFMVGETVAVGGNLRLLNFSAAGERLAITAGASDEISNGTTTAANTTGDLWPLNTKKIVMAQTTTAIHRIRVDSGTLFESAANSPIAGDSIYVAGNPSGVHNCRVYALLVYTSELDSAAQLRVRQYLKAKWGTP